MAKNDFPYKAKDLYFDAIQALAELDGQGNAESMLTAIINRCKIPEEILKIPHKGKSNKSEVQYQFEWALTDLKNSGYFIKIGRDWKLTERGWAASKKDKPGQFGVQKDSDMGEQKKDNFYCDLAKLKGEKIYSYTKGNESIYFHLVDINTIGVDEDVDEEEGTKGASRTRGEITFQRSEIETLVSSAEIETIKKERVERLALALIWGKAVDVASLFPDVKDATWIFALEGLFAASPHVFIYKGGAAQQLFWNPDISHEIGEIVEIQSLERAPLSIEAFDGEGKSSSDKSSVKKVPRSWPYQEVVYGAPGVGKSYRIEKEMGEYEPIRTTFHPDSDYSSFVGAYKPIMKKVTRTALDGTKPKKADVPGLEEDPQEETIAYEFRAQAFIKAYVKAWEKFAEGEPVFLLIEELNRGNSAQIFGDIFQLLDRGADGFSVYPIDADEDLRAYLGKELSGLDEKAMGLEEGLAGKVKKGEKLVLPSNLYIRATMNTSDQSLFPMDSAFKRRWDWVYVPICNAGKNWKVVAQGKEFDWYDFLVKVNGAIRKTLKNADKQMGYFFIQADGEGKISAGRFVQKVLFYLFNDVFKDWELPMDIFKKSGDEAYQFGDFFDENGGVKEAEVASFLSGILGGESGKSAAEEA